MKRNMLSIIILALLIINIVLTAIMMVSVLQTNSKTAAVVSDIAAAVELEAGGGAGNASGFGRDATNVPANERANYDITDVTIALSSQDDKVHYLACSVTLTMDTVNADYETYGTAEIMEGNVSVIKSKINDVVGKYTYEQITQDPQNIKETMQTEILETLQDYFSSAFIIEVSFSSFLTT
ncbi:flagellar basal body-associated FliL family protein [Butyrivibrio sp. MC2013]|uniref:flagellar basal body-associated FliL family protein n=1 Tax=Butyrivibrio sp. MC2013 TaxID=1280686 RepID=UPI00040A2B3A|nr:flagellar basal body-associated FliL family protein [Butyrivibrio sp. MC2013]